MEYQKPERTAVKAWRLARAVTLAAITVALIAAAIGTIITEERWLFFTGVGLGLLAVYKLAGLFVYPMIEYRQWKYAISDEKVEIVHGIFYITRDIIPVIRIQNITVKQGPIYRRYGLYTVEIALASGKFEIVGLNQETAETIAERVREKLYLRLQKEGI